MKIFEELNKDYKVFYDKLDMSLSYLYDKYYKYFDENKKERLFILNDLSSDLEKVSNLLDNYGYTYTPSSFGDIDEDNFEEVLMRYLESFKKYVDNGESNVETINVNIKYLLYLVDKHKNKTEHFV